MKNNVAGITNVLIIIFFSLIWLGITAFLHFKKRKSITYLFFFTIFCIYLYKVLDYTLLRFQSLLLLKYFMPNIMLNGIRAGKSLNLIPLVTLRLVDVKTSLFNILMMIPFGFGLSFITNLSRRQIIIIGLLFSIAIEFLQFITGFMAKITFRVADINDLIFNTIGVTVGYILFIGFVSLLSTFSIRTKKWFDTIIR